MLVVLTNGIAGSAEVLAGVCELDVFQGERGHPCMAAYHNISIEALKGEKEKEKIITFTYKARHFQRS